MALRKQKSLGKRLLERDILTPPRAGKWTGTGVNVLADGC